MKKYFGIVLLFAFFFGSQSAFAENAVSPELQRERAREMAEKATALREQIQDKKTAATDTVARTKELREKIQQMGSSLLRHEMVKRAVFGFAQMQNIEKRMENRIAKLKAAGVDVTALDVKVTAVKTAMDSAKAKLEALKEAIVALPETQTKDEKATSTATIMALKKDAEAAVKNVRVALEDLLKSLKTYKMPEQARNGENN